MKPAELLLDMEGVELDARVKVARYLIDCILPFTAFLEVDAVGFGADLTEYQAELDYIKSREPSLRRGFLGLWHKRGLLGFNLDPASDRDCGVFRGFAPLALNAKMGDSAGLLLELDDSSESAVVRDAVVETGPLRSLLIEVGANPDEVITRRSAGR